jgi:Domain of unknown function (DUF5666)
MQRTRNTTALYVILALVVSAVSMSAFAEDRSIWRTARDIQDGVRGAVIGTITDVDSARNRLYVTADDDRSDRVTVSTTGSTQYSGFGVGSTVFNGANGFSEVRTGDRVEVRGVGRGSGNMVGDNVILLGRSAGSSTSTSTNSPASSRYEGVVRQVNAADSRLVIENDAREMLTILGTPTTPVYYQRETYRIENIEVGDRIRVDPSSTTSGDIRARSIEVISSVSDNTTPGGTSRTNTVGSISGRVTYVDTRANTFRVDTGRGTDVTVDVARATDDKRTRVKANDFLVGDRVTATGTWVGQNTFRATTIRWGLDNTTAGGTTSGTGSSSSDTPARPEYISVVIYGTVQDTLKSSSTISVKDKDMDRTIRVMLSEDFAVRTKTGTYTTADTLKQGDQVVVKAYRDNYGNYIAQTLRIR